MTRCKCDTTRYMIENDFFTRSCAGLDVYWAGFYDIHKDKEQSKHIRYCPFCGERLPKRKVSEEE